MDGAEQEQGPSRRTSLKRTFDQISRSPPPETSYQPQPAWASRFQQAVQNRSSMTNRQSNRPRSPAPGPSTHRYHGDGLDFRRPVVSQSFEPTREASSMEWRTGQEVIDLTADSPQLERARGRRRSHSPVSSRLASHEHPDVIDLSYLDSFDTPGSPIGPTFGNFPEIPSRATRRADTPTVDLTGPTFIDVDDEEVQFISENPIQQRSESTGSYLRRLAQIHSSLGTGHRTDGHPPVERQRSPWPDVSRRRNRQRLARLDESLRSNERAANQAGGMDASTYRATRPIDRMVGSLYTLLHGDALGGFELPPLNMNFTEVAFNVHTGQASRPTYEAPPAVPKGFTRSPKEDDVVVCPNCDHELGQGEDKDKQVWAIRECGHVYCGVCAGTRKIGNKKSTAIPTDEERPRRQRTLSNCAADGCASKTSGKTKMFQVYI